MFSEGKRVGPPLDIIEVIVIPQVTKSILSDKDFEIKEIFNYPSNIIEYISIEGTRIIKTKDKTYVGHKPKIDQTCSHLAVTPQLNQIIDGQVDSGKLKLYNIKDKIEVSCNISAKDIMSCDGRIFIKNESMISEIDFIEIPNNIQVSCVPIANVLENATNFFYGGAIQNVMGSYFVSLFPKRKMHYQIKCDEINEYKIIDAKYDNHVLIIIGSKKGKYDKFILKFNDNFSSYSVRKVDNVTYSGINFVTLDNGIVIHINEQEELEIFSNKKESNSVKTISSSTISGDMKLFKEGSQTLFSKNNILQKINLKK
jgi:hypothetical protein